MAKKLKIEPKQAITWLVITALFASCSYARIFGSVVTFSISLFVGLAYVNKNVLILTPILLLSMVVAEPIWQTVIIALFPCAVFTVTYVVFRKMKKRMKPYVAVILTAISELPLFFVYGINVNTTVNAFINIAISSLFSFFCIKACYLFFVKGMKYKPVTIERISIWSVLFVISLGVYRLKIGSVYLGAILMSLFACFSVYFYAEKGFVSTIVCALSCVFSDKNVVGFVVCVIGVIFVLIFKRYRRFSFLAFPIVDLIIGYGTKTIIGYSFVNAILFFVGGLAFALLPNKAINEYLSNVGVERGYAVRTLVNRNRYDVYKRLDKISTVLKEMAKVVKADDDELKEPIENVKYLSEKLASSVCSDCPQRNGCEKMLTGSPSVATYDLVSNVLKAQRVSILEMPSFLVEYCARSVKMLSSCKEMLENYTVKKELSENVNACKTLMYEQINGLSGMIGGFAKEIKQTVSFDSTKEKELIESLSQVNVIAPEAVIYGGKDVQTLVLTVREQDENKPALNKTIKKMLGNMILSDKTKGKGVVNMTFVDAPKLDYMQGVATMSKIEGASGDSYSIVPLSPEKVMFVICDGMGCGKQAEEVSEKAITLVETFYKAGLDENGVLSIINKLLSSKSGENFSALDICVVNLRTGVCDFIKLGGVESVLFHKNGYEVIEGGALPIGILETVKPRVTRRKIESGDMIVMFSDGITDSIGSDGVIRISEQNKTNNPEKLAADVIEDSEFVGRADDKTVLCVKIFNRL